MNRLVLALLLLATPVYAGRLLIVRPNTYQPNTNSVNKQSEMMWTDACNKRNIAYDVRPQSDVPTLYLKNGVVNTSVTTSTAYDAAILLDYQPFYTGGNVAPGYNPDSLTRYFYWPSIPIAFVGRCTTPGGGMWTQDTSQTTRPQTGASGVGAASVVQSALSAQLIGDPNSWKSWDCMFFSSTPLTRVLGSGVTRTVIASRVTSGKNSGFVSVSAGVSVPWADDMVMMNQTTADSNLVLWARYRADASGNGTGTPLLFVWPQNSNTSTFDEVAIGGTLAMLDSACAGRLFGSSPKGSYQPLRKSIYIGHAFSRSNINSTSTADGGALVCLPDTCDSLYEKQSIDSLATLKDSKGRPIPIDVGTNVDSVGAYPYEKAWWARLGDVKYVLEDWTGYSGVNANGGNTSKNLRIDPFGFNRSRKLITPFRFCCADLCDGGDTTLACNLAYAKASMDSIFGDKSGRSVVATDFDYIPSNFTREIMPNPDSLNAAIIRAGFRTVLISPDAQKTAPSMQWGLNGVGTNFVVPTILAMNSHNGRFTVRSSNGVIGNIYWATCRGLDTDGLNRGLVGTHPWHSEFFMGVYSELWYPQDLVYYFHNFKTPLDVFSIRAGDLATIRGAAGGVPMRLGWYQIKWTVNAQNAVSRLSWPGHEPIQWVHMEDL